MLTHGDIRAPSSSSSSSSLSTTSTSTVVPATARNPPHSRSAAPSSASILGSNTSSSSDSTATPVPHQSALPMLRSRGADSSSSFSSHLPSPSRSSQAAAVRSTNFSTYAIIKASLVSYLSSSKVSTFFLLFIVIPLISLVLRARHRRQRSLLALPGVSSNAEIARRRLQKNAAGGAGFLGRAWSEVIRVTADTVKMAGSGLV